MLALNPTGDVREIARIVQGWEFSYAEMRARLGVEPDLGL
jgi:hypothetical protein